MPYTTAFSVELDNREIVENLAKRHKLSQVINTLMREYRQRTGAENIKFVDIRTAEDIEKYITEISSDPRMTKYIADTTRERLLGELGQGAFIINTTTGEHKKIFKEESK